MGENKTSDNDEIASMEIDALEFLQGKMSEKAIRLMSNKIVSK